MVVCPLCEHAQASGAECDVCGRLLRAPGEAAAPALLAELEPTRLEAAPGPAPDRLADLEPSGFAAARIGSLEDTSSWLERTEVGRAGLVTVEPLEVERTGPADAPEARGPPADPTCRYCRTPSQPGEVFCGRCGMKLARYQPSAPEPPRPEAARCRLCGARVTTSACPACGARLSEG